MPTFAVETPTIFEIPMVCVNPDEDANSFALELGPLTIGVEKNLQESGWVWSVRTSHTEDWESTNAATARLAARAAEAYLRTILSMLGAVAKAPTITRKAV
jgi:hypothetical protein